MKLPCAVIWDTVEPCPMSPLKYHACIKEHEHYSTPHECQCGGTK